MDGLPVLTLKLSSTKPGPLLVFFKALAPEPPNTVPNTEQLLITAVQ